MTYTASSTIPHKSDIARPAKTPHAGLNQFHRLARLLDTQLGVPGVPFRFGIDGVLGMIPVVGDTLTAGMGLFALQLAHSHNLPRRAKFAMLRNIAVDWVVGSIPLVGDLFDFAFHAHAKNAKILERYINPGQDQQDEHA